MVMPATAPAISPFVIVHLTNNTQIALPEVTIFNIQRSCASRVRVVGLSVCLSVCLSASVDAYFGITGYEAATSDTNGCRTTGT